MSPPFDNPSKHKALVQSLLRACGLAHWSEVLWKWLEHYTGLEDLVDEERHAPVAAVVSLLRTMARVEAKPTDECFAALLANLEFLDYRVRRSSDRARPSFEDGETWDPESSDLQQWAGEHPLGTWREATTLRMQEGIAQELLKQLRLRQ